MATVTREVASPLGVVTLVRRVVSAPIEIRSKIAGDIPAPIEINAPSILSPTSISLGGATKVTFDSLSQDITNYMERGGSARTDPTVFNQIPRLINAAERKLIQALKLLGTIENLVAAGANGLQASNQIVTKPDRWRQTVSLGFMGTGGYVPLYTRSAEYCQFYWPDPNQTSPPELYAELDLAHWLIVPTPDKDYTILARCYMQPPLLSAVNQNNFFTEYTPNALVYGALIETALFLKDDAALTRFGQPYQFELQTLTAQDLQRILDRTSERQRP